MQNFEKAKQAFYALALQNVLLFFYSTSKIKISPEGNKKYPKQSKLISKALVNRIKFMVLLIYLMPNLTWAQQTQPLINSTLVGKVVDARTKEILPGATVAIKGTTHKVSVDSDGKFSFVTGQNFLIH
ncbi:carboxypeptidase-like regulatory domain-containing protein [Arcticibacter eurypsychrophilus]|uniref:carboxypeptidase-like regulatory domain-containing protein n=1 Tax=Arcticibacter eurypsychrophilus TaxID=1434752 RepID=UPI00084D9AA8|nr:carboxypeptidase-like regulatory domain-containing protein [Arcticibacter eurypsychrophilus]